MSSMGGKVIEAGNVDVFGANVTAMHTSTGPFYGTSMDEDGSYPIDNKQVGGPYTLTYSFVGLEDVIVTNIPLRLGERYTKDGEMGSSALQLDEIIVRAAAGSLGGSTGASTQISTEDIELMPTLNRNGTDYTRLTPQANGNSFAGSNNRFNAIFVDGAVNNDVFGLAEQGTNGGQAGITLLVWMSLTKSKSYYRHMM